jgi:ribosomal protein L29
MAILKMKEVSKMTDKEKQDRLKALKLELVKANVAANKTNSKTKEIKRAISRLLTSRKLSTSKKEALKK